MRVTLLSAHIDQIKTACASNNVRSLFAFGSVAKDNFKPDSDIDLIVDIAEADPFAYTAFYFSLKDQLEKILNRRIDLLEQKAVRNSFIRNEIEQTKILVYGK